MKAVFAILALMLFFADASASGRKTLEASRVDVPPIIDGRSPDPRADEPHHGAGEIGNALQLSFR